MNIFTHLHVHSHYSILSATAKPKTLVKRAKELGLKALALTDNSATSGLVEFYKACKDENIHSVLGCDMNIAPLGCDKKEGRDDRKTNQIVLLAENYDGYQNLLKLSTIAHLDGFYHKPRIDDELLLKHGNGLIALTGGITGAIPEALIDGEEEKAKKTLDLYKKAFGEHSVFIEIQYHPNFPEQMKANKLLIEFAFKYEVPLIVAQSVYYPTPEDKESHDVLLCIRDGVNMHDENRFTLPDDYSLCSSFAIEEWFKSMDDSRLVVTKEKEEIVFSPIENTENIAKRCKVELPLGQSLIPSFDCPDKLSEQEYLKNLCLDGLKSRYKEITKELEDRLKYELSIIHQMGFDAYFLIVWDFINYSKQNDIMVGPGRGSAAGSIVAYTLGITDIDPIRFDLIFERFLNPERVSMPDIDIDFIDTKRDLVIKYVQGKYGADKVAQIITFGTMAARAAVRDCTRALGYSYSTGDKIAKAIPNEVGQKLQDALDTEVILKEIYKEADAKKVIDTALKLEGCIRNTSVHAAALVIARDPLTETTALAEASKGEGVIVTQYSMKPIEELGLLKMDFLGLRNLSILERAVNIIKDSLGEEIDIAHIHIDDKKTYEMVARGETIGVFQFESAGMRKYLKDLSPTCIEDLIAMTSLYRPGPMDYIGNYIEGKRSPDKVKYLDPCLEDVLSETYGIAVYQEQIQRIAQVFAGYSLGEADILRRAMGKKILKVIQEQKDVFVERAIKNGKKKELAEKIFSFIEPFARYGFNKAHAASYAMISYQTAYLKANYPLEFMIALLTAEMNNTEKVILVSSDCIRMGIAILPPSVNYSLADFSIDKEKNAIRFGLSAIKNIGEGPATAIIEARKEDGLEKTFLDIGDFAKRVGSKFVNKKVLESLAKVGAFDDMYERNQVLENIETIIDFSKREEKLKTSMQIDLFSTLPDAGTGELVLPEMVSATVDEKLCWEKELLGVYVSSHPLSGLEMYLDKYTTPIASFPELKDDTKIRIGGIITRAITKVDKNGNKMAFITVEDKSGEIEGVIFSRSYVDMEDFMEDGNIVVLEAKLVTREFNNEEKRSLIINKGKKVDLVKARNMKKEKEGTRDEGRGAKENADDVATQDLVSNNEEKKEKKSLINPKGVLKVPEEKEEVISKFSIDVPKGTTPEVLTELKNLLKKHEGKNIGMLHVAGNDTTVHYVDIPFGVNWGEELEGKVKGVLGL